MKLYVSPGACSMSCHIAFEEAGMKYDLAVGDWDTVGSLNPMGAVPVLTLDDGKTLTQNIAILTYAATKAPKLLPALGTYDFAETYQWLSWTASDLHPAFGPLFSDSITPEAQKESETEVHTLLAIAEKHLKGKDFIAGNQFTLADAYFFTVYSWTKGVEIPTDAYPTLNAYSARVAERPAVMKAMKDEGLLK